MGAAVEWDTDGHVGDADDWSDGWRSALMGQPWQANPYPMGTIEYQRWRDGWEDAGGEGAP